jgi:outer membrane protein assembly factor BamA
MIFDFRIMLLDLLVMNRLRCFSGILIFLVLSFYAGAQDKYRLHYFFIDKDTAFTADMVGLQTDFTNELNCKIYLDKVNGIFKSKGYINVSVDSTAFDSSAAQVWVYVGEQYQWVKLNTDSADKKMLSGIGWNEKNISKTPLDFKKLEYWQEKMLDYYEDNGYPFAKIQLDSLELSDGKLSALLKTEKGPEYVIDSIRVYGKANISNYFLQRYLGIENGSLYKKEKLQTISRKLLELPYLKEIKVWDLTMNGSGSILNLYIDPKKSSQVDVLVGFLPATDAPGRTKLQLTGEANINLKNALGAGESIGVNWQQIQIKSPRLHLLYQHPYIFNTPFGIDFNFDLLKKDSSFLNLNAQFGIQYISTGKQTATVFIQNISTNVLPAGIDTAQIKAAKRLPSYIDVNNTNLGVRYIYNSTDYRFNPRRGNEANIVLSAGVRKIKPNTAVLKMTKDASGNDFNYASLYDSLDTKTYLVRINVSGAHYFKAGKQAVVKTALNAGGIYTHNIFRNEMFQIGGYKLLRGFDEESIYASSYAVMTAEYRFFIGLNSYFFGFADGAWVNSKAYTDLQTNANTYLGFGIGMAFETKAGIFNLSYAVGKRDDTSLNFRQAKIHFGLVSLF